MNQAPAANAHAANLPVAFRNPCLRWKQHQLQPTSTCNVCAYNPVTGLVRVGGRGSGITQIWYHLNQPAHLDYVNQGRDTEAMAAGYALYDADPLAYEDRWQCLICSLDKEGCPRMKYASILTQSVLTHLASGPHARREADGRQALYAAKHVGHPGPLPGEMW